MIKLLFILLFISIKVFSYTVTDTLSDTTSTEPAGAREDMTDYSEQYELSINNVDIELQKLRTLPTLNGEMINIINIKSILDTTDYAIEQKIVSENKKITNLHNYLNNSADERKIQKIKRALNTRLLKPEDIVSVYVKGSGGINLYYYKKEIRK